MKFVRRHEPPQAERVSPGTGAPSVFPSEYGWQSGVRFLEEGSSRPTTEPDSVDGGEFLPWIKMYRRGVTISPFEIRRRQTHDQLARVLKVSDPLQEQVRKWRAGTEPGSIDEVKQLFYRVTEHVTQGDYLDFYRDASHVAVTGEGSRLVLLKAAYDVVGIESDIYMVKSTYETPTVLPIGEAQRYGRGVLRVQTEAGVHWVAPNQRDAMFGAVPVGSMGQPAVCVTCDADERTRTSLPTDGYRPNTREIEITGSLNKEGTLTGTAAMTFHGVRAATVRNSLRERPDESSRRSFFDSVMSSVISGASLQSYDILGIDEDDEPLTIEIEFERTGFARPVSGDSESSRMRIQTSVFGTPLASRYAALAERQRPLMIGRQRNDRQTLTVELPDGMTADITSQSGEWSYDSSFGTFERHTAATDGQLRIENRLKLPIQRISTKRYGEFQSWAVKVERSARVEAVVQAN